MPRYSLKKAFSNESIEPKEVILNEGFFTDLAATIAAGGMQGVKDIIMGKLEQFSKKASELENSQALDLVQRFRKMGLKNLGGENLEKIERALRRRQKRKPKKVDTKKLEDLLFGGLDENTCPFKKASLRDFFLED